MAMQHNSKVDVISWISDFLDYLQRETGFSKEAFTRAGLMNRLQKVSKKCYQLEIVESLLCNVIYISKTMSDTMKTYSQKVDKVIESFLDVFEKIVNFLFKTFLGRGVLIITSSMSSKMTAFVIGLYFLISFLYNNFSAFWITKLKEYMKSFAYSEQFKNFFGHFKSTKYAIQ